MSTSRNFEAKLSSSLRSLNLDRAAAAETFQATSNIHYSMVWVLMLEFLQMPVKGFHGCTLRH